MKNIRYILTLIVGLITVFFTWTYIQRANFDYNSEGRFFSADDQIVYSQQAKELYGILTIIGLILTVILLLKLIKEHTHN
jgi:TRAP-type C4-dicarboxylate transport system permease small subunit